jgi:hypothetical protein
MHKILCAAVLLSMVAIVPAMAQTGPGTGPATGAATTQNDDDDFDLGWLGLLGLAGLAGLAGRKKHDATVSRH